MPTLHLRHLASSLFCTLLLSAPLLHAQEPADEEDKEWREVALQLPEAPKAENLLNFYKSNSQSFAIDTKSLLVASDGTIRYTLVATSDGGAKNISYEGLRCQSYEVKLFAFGRPDGTWSRSRRNQWDAISSTGANKQHSTLFSDYFCEGRTIAGKVNVLLDKLRGKKMSYY
ncbi:CNP1-like family protein [Undibacterium sp. CY18W]|uniref:CNP1-like family protein n=1 Tax=Undibacterium hunanense TaxID=2762292 RepID=A0ABR6ZPM7_9BURK|nr:CNP1-like family protein [Undibacterium hunanense]MBC3917754.1 CNP1-like family protein [Undibacterium hunanense]